MTGWTLFLTMLGAAVLIAQFFRLIDLIERPRSHAPLSALLQKDWQALLSDLRRHKWTFWKN